VGEQAFCFLFQLSVFVFQCVTDWLRCELASFLVALAPNRKHPKRMKERKTGEKKKYEKHLGGKLVVLVIRAGIR
jgi:hypothetical protein